MQTELFADYLVPWIELDICENVRSNLISSFCRTILLLALIDSSRLTIIWLNKLCFKYLRTGWRLCEVFLGEQRLEYEFI